MAMEVDRLTVKVDTDFRGLTSGLQSATRNIQGFKKEVEGTQAQIAKGADFPVRTDTRQVDLAKSKVGGLRQDLNTGGTFQVRADDSQLTGITSHIGAIRSDAANGGTFVMRGDDSGITGLGVSLERIRQDAANGGTFKLDADITGLEGATAGIQAIKAESASADDTIHIGAEVDEAAATGKLVAFQGLVSWFDGKKINMPIDINSVSAVAGLFSVQAAVITTVAQLAGLSLTSAVASGSLTGLGATAATVTAGLLSIAAAGVAIYTALQIAQTGISALLGGLAAVGAAAALAATGFGLIGAAGYVLYQAVQDNTAGLGYLKESLSGLKANFQEAFLPAAGLLDDIVQKLIDMANNALPFLGAQAHTATVALNEGINNVIETISSAPLMESDLALFFSNMPTVVASLTTAVGNFGAGLFSILAQASPAAAELAQWIQSIAESFFQWTQSEAGRAAIASWIDTARTVLPAVKDAIVSIADAFINMEGFDAETLASGIRGIGTAIAGIIGFVDTVKQGWDAFDAAINATLDFIVSWIPEVNLLDKIMGDTEGVDVSALLESLSTAWTAVNDWIAGLVPDITLMDVLMGRGTLTGAAESGGLAAQLIQLLSDGVNGAMDWLVSWVPEVNLLDKIMGVTEEDPGGTNLIEAIQGIWNSASEFIAGLAPEITLMDVIMGGATLEEAAAEGGLAAQLIAALEPAWTAVNEWIAGLAPEITLMDVIMGNATMGEAVEEGGIAANIIASLTEAWTAVSEWIAGLAPEVTLMDVIMGNATMGEAVEEGGIAATIIASLTEAWTSVTEWIAGLAPEVTLMDVIMGNASMEEAADSGSIAAQAIEALQGAWDSVMEWLGGLVPDISLTDIILGVETVATTVGEFIAAIGEAFASGWATITQAFSDFFTSLYNDYWLYYFGLDGVLVTGILDFFTTLYNDYWLYYFGADGVLVTGILDFFTTLYNDYWLYYFGADGVLVTGILDFFTTLYNDYWLYYFGLDGILITGLIDFFTTLYNDYWLYYFGLDGVLITGIIDFFTSLYNDYWLYYFGLDGVLVTGILDFFTTLYNDYWLYYFGLDGVLITGIIDFFTTLYNDYWLYYFGLDGALIGPIIEFFTTLYNDYFLYYLGSEGVIVTAVQAAWDAILTAIPEFVRGFGNLLGNGLASAINAGIGYLEGLLTAINAVLTAIGVTNINATLDRVTFEEFASGGSTESMAAGGSRGGSGTRGKQPRHIIWNEGMGEEYWIATGPAADKRKNVGWLAKAASKLGLGVVPMQAGGVIGSGGRLAGVNRTRVRPPVEYLAREFPDETTTASTASTASTVGATTAATGEKKLTRRQKRRARRRERRQGTTTSTGLTGTTSPATTTAPTSSVPGTSAVDAMPAATSDLAAPAGMTRVPTTTGGSRTGRRRGRQRGRTHRGGARFSNMHRGRRRHKRAGGGDTTFMAIGGGTDVGPAGLGERAGGIAQEIMDAFGVWANTYVGGATPHGSLHGNVPENTFDFWGDSGFTPLDVGTGDAIRQYLYDNYGSELDTVIWQGVGEGPRGAFDDGEHFDHLHASIGGGGLLNTAGVLAASLFNKIKGIWDSFMSALAPPDMGEGAVWDGIETYLLTLPAMAWEYLKSLIPRGTGGSLSGLGRGGAPLSGDLQTMAEQAIEAAGWPASELQALTDLWQNESGWDANAVNPDSGAYGIPQINPASWPDAPPVGDAAGQIQWGVDYIKELYGSPTAALDFWLANNSYARGGVVPGASPQAAVVHGGERVLPQNINRGFENLAQAVDRWDDNSASGMGGAGANSEAEAVLEDILVEIKRGNDNPTPVDINNMSAMQRLVYNAFMAGIESDATTEVLDQKMAEGVRFASTLGGL